MKIRMERYNAERRIFVDENGIEWSAELIGILIAHLVPFDVEVPEDHERFQDWLIRYEELKRRVKEDEN